MLAIPNCARTSTGWIPSAVPAAPDHAPPSAANTVAVMPGSPPGSIAASRTACRAPVVEWEKEPVGTAGKCPSVPAGRLADRYGVKQAFLFGLAVFTLGSLGCALSSDLWVIVGLRCVQALGAAALVPTSLGLILTAIPAERRKHSIQIWAVSGSLGAAAGPALGGLLVQASWRWIFVLNIPIGVIALVAAAILAPNIKHSVERRVPDLWGGLLLTAAIGALTLALVQGSGWGWSSIRILVAFGASVIGLALFVTRSSRHASPIIDLHLFRYQVFAWANVALFLISISFGAQLLGLALWLQQGWGWSAIETGFGIAPGPVMVSVA